LQNLNIKEELRKLAGLQKLDSKIFSLKQEAARHPKMQQDIDAEFEEKKATFKALEEKKQKIQLAQKTKESELAVKEDNIKKTQGQLGQLKTNKDYQAKLAEIESLKADKSLIEEEILKLMDDTEEAKRSVEAEKKALEAEEKTYRDRKKALEEKTRELEGCINDLEGQRKILVSSVEKEILKVYEHILQGREGSALVQVISNSCEGCHMRVPHQVINEIKMYSRLITCENCSRILYLEEDILT